MEAQSHFRNLHGNLHIPLQMLGVPGLISVLSFGVSLASPGSLVLSHRDRVDPAGRMQVVHRHSVLPPRPPLQVAKKEV